jgi:hypothetical protein
MTETVLIALNTLNYLAFQSSDFECTWWRLFQKRVVCNKFDIYVIVNFILNYICPWNLLHPVEQWNTTISEQNNKIKYWHVVRGKFDTFNTQIHDRSFSWLSTDTLITKGEVNYFWKSIIINIKNIISDQ